jgi:hypothetical protein
VGLGKESHVNKTYLKYHSTFVGKEAFWKIFMKSSFGFSVFMFYAAG